MKCILFSQFDSFPSKPHRLVWDEKPRENIGVEGEGATAEDEPATAEPAPKEPGQRPGLSPDVQAQHHRQQQLDATAAEANLTLDAYRDRLIALFNTKDFDKMAAEIAKINDEMTEKDKASINKFITERATDEANQKFREKFSIKDDIDENEFKKMREKWTELSIEEYAVLLALMEESVAKQELSQDDKVKAEKCLFGAKIALVAENDRLEKAKPPYSDKELKTVGEKHAVTIEEARKSSDQDAILAEKIPDEHERKIVKWMLDAQKEKEKAGSAIAETLEAGGFAALLERLLTKLFQLIEYASVAVEKFLAKFEKNKTPAKAPDRFPHSPIGKNGMFTINRKFEEGKNGIELKTATPDAKATWILDNEAEVAEIGEHSVTLQLGNERVIYEGIKPSVKKGDKIKQGAELGALESKVLALQFIDIHGKQRDPSEYLKAFTEETVAAAPTTAAAVAPTAAPSAAPAQQTAAQTAAPEKTPSTTPPAEEGDDEEDAEGKAPAAPAAAAAEKAPETALDLKTYLADEIKKLDGKTIDIETGHEFKLPSPDGTRLWTYRIQGNRIEIGSFKYTINLPITPKTITFKGNEVTIDLPIIGKRPLTLEPDKLLPHIEELSKGTRDSYTIATKVGNITFKKIA